MLFLPRHEDPGLGALRPVETGDELPERKDLLALFRHPKELDQVRRLREHEKHAAGGPVGVVRKGARRRRVLEPGLELVLVHLLQRLEQVGQRAFLLFPEFPDHVGDEDAAGLQPDILVLITGLGDELLRDAIGVGGVGDLGEGRPIDAAGIERIEDDVAALGPEVMGDELSAGVIDQRGFAARRDPVEQLAQHRRLAAARRSDQRNVPGFEAAGKGDGADRQRMRTRFGSRQLHKLLLARHLGAVDDAIAERAFAPPRGDIAEQEQARQPSDKSQHGAAHDKRLGDARPADKIWIGRDRASGRQIVLPLVTDHYPGIAAVARKP